MKSVLISIQPKWCEKIANGEKTIEVRKTKPKLEPPFKCYIYCTQPRFPHEDYIVVFDKPDSFYAGGKVIGEFVCDSILRHCEMANIDIAEQCSCVSRKDIRNYSQGKEVYGWNINNLKIYDQPKQLSSFNKPCPYRLPDGSRMDVPCPCDKYTWEFDEQTGLAYCMRKVEKPPQSWCYVEGGDV